MSHCLPQPSLFPRSFRSGLPFLGLAAILLASGQSLVAQGVVVTPVPTWQSSPTLTKFMTELRAPGLIPVALPDGTRTFTGSKLVANHYTIDINQYTDQLHPSLPPTTLWGYNPTRALGVAVGTIPLQKHLGGIIIAQKGVPTQITFRNNLPTSHILPVDTSIQGADPTVIPNRTATHLHGGQVPWTSDGGPFSFWDPQGNQGISFLNNKVLRPLESAAGVVPKNEAEYYYPNNQSARMMWYHDHAMGITRLNAYAGIASAYLIRDTYEAALVRDFGLPGFVENGGRELPLIFQDKIFQNGNAPSDPARPFPGSAVGQGNLWYPYEYDPALWNDTTAVGVSVVPEAFGDTMLVNGAPYPKASVDPRRYRLRILNACNARVLNLSLYEDDGTGHPDFTKPGPAWTVIGTEGGFLAKPVSVPAGRLVYGIDAQGGAFLNPAAPGGSLIVAPAERFDVVLDLNGKGGKKYILFNDAPGPYPSGAPENDYPNAAGVGDTFVLMRFEVKPDAKTIAKDPAFKLTPTTPLASVSDAKIDPPLAGPVASAASASWASITTAPLPIPTRKGIVVRQLTLNEAVDAYNRLIQMLGTNIKTPAGDFGRPYYDPKDAAGSIPTEVSTNNATEVWQIANLTADTHPIHFHLSNVQILSRQGFDWQTYGTTTAIGAAATPTLMGPARGPEATEIGWKETVKMHPGEITTVIMKLALPAVPFVVPVSPRTGGNEYVWHCHILEHEEHDMMRTLVVK